LGGEHQPRLELEQRGDQDQELGCGLEVELVGRLQVIQVGDDDLGEVDLQQVELLAQDERQQQVEGTGEDVEVQLQLGESHGPEGYAGVRTGPTPIASRTSATTGPAIACALAAPASRKASICAVSSLSSR